MKGNTKRNTVTLPLSSLILSESNARKQRKPESIESMAASFAAVGMIQNLVVIPSQESGVYEVIAGGTRLLAYQLRLSRGEIQDSEPVECLIREKDQATLLSTIENVQRDPMHPADEFDAIQRMFNNGKGMSIDRIADALGVTPLVVERRMKLAAAAPELLDEFRNDEISTDQLIALSATDDHAKQIEVWQRSKDRHWMSDPKSLRRAVLGESEVDVSNDPRIPFIGGLQVYRDAGGDVRPDLFTGDGSGGFISDESLLDKLVADKLEVQAEALRAEGWGWVEIWLSFDHSAFNRLGKAPQVVLLSEAEQEHYKRLQAEGEQLQAEQEKLENGEELTEEQSERLDAIFERLQELDDLLADIEADNASFTPQVKASSGALVAFDRSGLRIERGLVRASDRKAVTAAAGDAEAVKGGRETESAGRKTDAMSDALRRSLLGHRNLAAQIVTAARPDVAKVLLACRVVEIIRKNGMHHYSGSSVPSDLAITGTLGARTCHPITDDAGTQKAKAFADSCKAVIADLPNADGKLWDALAAKSAEELDRIIAHGVALSVSLDNEHKGFTGKFLDALGFDMAAHFSATADNYLGRVPKTLVLAALKEADCDHGREQLDKLKKGELAREAESRLATTGWVPKLIRTPTPKAPKADKPTGAKGKTAKAPPKAAKPAKGKASKTKPKAAKAAKAKAK